MHYPGVFLTRPIRIAIMLCLFLSCSILSPLIILYTAGYTFNFSTFHIEQTGVISIDVTPNDAKVYLNNIFINAKLPIRLANYLPGVYHLRIQKEGYHDWVQDISVETKKTTYIKDISLYKEATPEKILSSSTGTNISFSSDGHFVAMLQNDSEGQSISLKNLLDNTETNIFHTTSSISPQIFWSPHTNLLLVVSQNGDAQDLVFYNPTNRVTFKTEVVSPTLSFQWDKKNLNRIYVQEGTNINAIDFGKSPHLLIAHTNSPIWYVDSNQRLWTQSASSNETILLIDTFKQTTSFHLPQNIDKIIDANENFLLGTYRGKALVFSQKNSAYALNKSFDFTRYFYSAAQSRYVFWSAWEIYSIDEAGKIDLLNRSGESIDDVFLLQESNSFLIKNRHSLIAFNPGYNTQQELLSNDNMEKVALDEKNHLILFSYSGDIYKLSF